MNKNVYVVNSNELPTPGNHNYTISKFSNGFKYHGYSVSEVTSLDSMIDNSIVILSDHGINNNNNNFNELEYLSKKYPNSIFICWFYHKWYKNIPFKKFVITGEHFHNKPQLPNHIFCWNLQQSINNYVPLTFSSSISPENVGKLPRNEIINGCFIGTAYKPSWVSNLDNVVYITGNRLSENKRIEIFLTSKIAFGFHANDNISNNVVVERVFEGMAFGCVVISDNPIAAVITDNIVQIANNKEEFLLIYNRLLNNSDERKILQEKGNESIKKKGLYVHTTKNFIDKFNELNF